MLTARGLVVEVGGVPVVADASFTVRARDKVGLVGRNGAGKTSLLRVLAGDAPAAGGAIGRSGALGYLAQEPRIADEGRSALSHVLSGRGIDEALARLEKLRLRLEEAPTDANVARYSRAHDRFELAGGYAAESEARRILAGLGVDADRLTLPVSVLSGGERRRVELGRILFAGSDLLLLDEPTNHLDVDAKEWLLGHLRGYHGALLVVSHDLDLLDDAITRVLHLDRRDEESPGTMVEYRGTYSQYLRARAEDEARRARQAAREQAEITRLSSLADRMRHSTEKRARKAKSLDTKVARLESRRTEVRRRERHVTVRFPDPPRCGRTVVEVDDLAKGYGSLDVFDSVTFSLGRGERLLALGMNGAGKTTLLRILAGLVEPDLGVVRWGHQVSVGYYAQEHELLEPDRTVIDHLRDAAPGHDDVTLRAMLGGFGLSGDKVFQEAGTLSGGEKTKLALTLLVAGRHNVLLLDEPTNNLDPRSRGATAEALRGWPGAMVLVSHDTAFVDALAPEKVLVMPEGQVDHFDAGYLELVALA